MATTVKTQQKIPVSAFLTALKSLDGIPYIWGGKNPSQDNGLDCSGAICYALKLAGGPDLSKLNQCDAHPNLYHGASTLALDCVQDRASEGVLAFYGPPGAPTHVMAVLYGGKAYGATGGGQLCTTVEKAKALKACVKEKNSYLYRPDLLMTGRLRFLSYP